MKLLNWFMGLFRKKKAVPDDLAVKIERRLDDRTLWTELTKNMDEVKTDAAIIERLYRFFHCYARNTT